MWPLRSCWSCWFLGWNNVGLLTGCPYLKGHNKKPWDLNKNSCLRFKVLICYLMFHKTGWNQKGSRNTGIMRLPVLIGFFLLIFFPFEGKKWWFRRREGRSGEQACNNSAQEVQKPPPVWKVRINSFNFLLLGSVNWSGGCCWQRGCCASGVPVGRSQQRALAEHKPAWDTSYRIDFWWQQQEEDALQGGLCPELFVLSSSLSDKAGKGVLQGTEFVPRMKVKWP